MEFDEVRLYQPGDDVRLIDWQVTARTGKPHTKLFREEREQPVYVLLDLAPSMFFASQGQLKAKLGARIAARIGWQTLRHKDRFALWFADAHGTVQEFAPKEHKPALLRMFGALVTTYNAHLEARPAAHQAFSFPKMLGHLRKVIRPGSRLWLISDFLQFDEEAWRLCRGLVHHNQLHGVWITDPLEETLGLRGELLFQEGEELLALRWGEEAEAAFASQFAEFKAATRQQWQRMRSSLREISTTESLQEV
jgi:uncharacterized protein (DUF58 family)